MTPDEQNLDMLVAELDRENRLLRARNERLEREAEQPAQQVVDSEEKAGAYMEERLWEFIDMAAAWPKASPDPRTWDHVVVYAPKPAQRTWVSLTQEERDHIWHTGGNSDAHGDVDGWSGRDVMNAIEAKLREKNQ